jgi:hypothetical protein
LSNIACPTAVNDHDGISIYIPSYTFFIPLDSASL